MPDKDNLGAVLQPVGYRWQNDRDGLVQDGTAPACRASSGSSGFHEMNHPVVVQGDTRATTAVVNMQGSKSNACVSTDGSSFTLNAMHGHDVHAVSVAFAQNQVGEVRVSDVTGTINTNSNASGRNTPMAAVAHAFYSTGGTHGVNQQPEVSPAVKVGSGLGIPSPPAVAFANRTRDGIKVPEVMVDGIVPALTNPGDGGRSDAINVAVAFTDAGQGQRIRTADESSETLRATKRGPFTDYYQAMTVRRLTPRECERLQAFPDDYTLIPWRKKAAADCPDGPRYKALGNSMAVNCMAWIGARIAAVENHDAN
jgi:DNA (cytosine-5)-methyltransferase 1